MDGAERVRPVLPDGFKGVSRRRGSSKAMHDGPGLISVSPDAEFENDLAFLSISQLERNLDGGAGIQGGPRLPGKPRPEHRRRLPERAVPPQELGPVAADRPSRIIYSE